MPTQRDMCWPLHGSWVEIMCQNGGFEVGEPVFRRTLFAAIEYDHEKGSVYGALKRARARYLFNAGMRSQYA
jgi:hypothetical protein